MNAINPYKLLGVNPNKPSLRKLKKSYYSLAKLCHPDKGGDPASMRIIHKCYLYIKKQFNNCNKNKSYEQLEEEFDTFCKNQKEKPPPFRDIWKGSDDYKKYKKFNETFEEMRKIDLKNGTNTMSSCFDNNGYGDVMEPSEYKIENTEAKLSLHSIINKCKNYNNCIKNTNKEVLKNKFKNEIIIYKEPKFNPIGYGNRHRFDIKKVNDFSSKTDNNISLCDYKKAFGHLDKEYFEKMKNITIKKKTLKELIRERELFDKNYNNNL